MSAITSKNPAREHFITATPRKDLVSVSSCIYLICAIKRPTTKQSILFTGNQTSESQEVFTSRLPIAHLLIEDLDLPLPKTLVSKNSAHIQDFVQLHR